MAGVPWRHEAIWQALAAHWRFRRGRSPLVMTSAIFHVTVRSGDDESSSSALKDSDDRFRFLAENVPVQIWTALPDGRLDYVTERTAAHFGVTVQHLLNNGWQTVVHPEDLPLAIERWTYSLRTGEPCEVEFRLRRSDGHYAYHLARAVPQRNAAGEIVRWFGTNTDIEATREEQRRIRTLLEEVAQQARESEAALVALRNARDDAERRIAELQAQLRTRK